MMLRQATKNLDEAVYIRYRLDGSLFNLRRLQAHTKTFEQLIRDLLFADDAALVAHSESALQCLTSSFAEAAQLFGLEVSLKKTEVLEVKPREEELTSQSDDSASRMKENGNVSDASVEQFYSVRINRMMSRSDAVARVALVTAYLNFRWFAVFTVV